MLTAASSLLCNAFSEVPQGRSIGGSIRCGAPIPERKTSCPLRNQFQCPSLFGLNMTTPKEEPTILCSSVLSSAAFESISSSSPNTCSNELPTSSRFTQPLPRRTPSDSKRTPLGCNDGLAPLSGRPYARPPCGRARRRLDGAFRPAEHFHRHPQQQPHAIRPCQPGFLGSLR